jgi:SAM-dependent methyltransferase
MTDYWRDEGKTRGMAPGNYRDTLSFIGKKIDPEKSFVVDLGCNRGWLAGFFPDYLGLDNNAVAIAEAQGYWAEKLGWTRKEAERHFRIWDANAPAAVERKADLVICKDFIEHLNSGHMLLQWIRGILKTNGYLLLISPDSQRWVWDDPTHVRPFSRRAHRFLAKAHGFRIVKESFESVMPGTQIVARMFSGRSPFPVRMMSRIPWWPRNVVSLMQLQGEDKNSGAGQT